MATPLFTFLNEKAQILESERIKNLRLSYLYKIVRLISDPYSRSGKKEQGNVSAEKPPAGSYKPCLTPLYKIILCVTPALCSCLNSNILPQP